ncbi:hypothetical protein [Nocardioides gansuensis]|uniref:hypothetical protein n=1 Tax=Nocardioides gansuensis TaxID=2138300 RepID=UPI001402D3AC|nr:hypothetical protein [Nocardioides gansuensis]
MRPVDAFGVVLTVVVLLGVAVLILLFERKRAREIQRDLRSMADQRDAGRTDEDGKDH